MKKQVTMWMSAMLISAAAATAGGLDFDLSWYTVNSGGGVSVGGDFELEGTIGQVDAGGELAGGEFTLTGGFWPGVQAAPAGDLIGDLNCDGLINTGDIDPFVLALLDPADYANSFPDCNRFNADANGDGLVNTGDIDPFVELLLN